MLLIIGFNQTTLLRDRAFSHRAPTPHNVPVDFGLTPYTTLFTPFTSLMIRVTIADEFHIEEKEVGGHTAGRGRHT
jgi:hypothetical protein